MTDQTSLHRLISCMNKCRRWDLSLILKRFYIDKGLVKEGIPNGKLRPIGAPTLSSKLISKSITNLIYLVYEDKFEEYQHGYRKHRGTHTALSEVWTRLFIEKKRFIYEFDFMSFFNRVDLKFV